MQSNVISGTTKLCPITVIESPINGDTGITLTAAGFMEMSVGYALIVKTLLADVAAVKVAGLLIVTCTPAPPKAVPLPTTTVIRVVETTLQDRVTCPVGGVLPIFAEHV